jgi:HK97 family phage major capsid protein
VIRTQQEAIARRKQLSESMSRMAQRSTLTPEDQVAFDHLEIEFRSLASLAADSSRASTRPPENPIGGEDRSTAEIWRDSQGREVRVLGPKDSLRSAVHGDRPRPGYDFGDFLQCLVRGKTENQELRADMGESSGNIGGFMVPTPLAVEIIDRLRAKSTVIQAGCRTVPFTAQTLWIARIATDPTIVQHAENTADLETDGPSIERVQFTAHALGCVIKCSRELVEDTTSGGGLGEVLTQIFAKAMAVEIDRECLLGTIGGGNQIVGLRNYPSVPTTAFDATPIDYTVILNGISALLTRNAAFPTAAIMSTRSYMKFAGLQNTLHDALRKPDILADLPFLETSKIPVNDNAGSPVTPNGSAVFIGDYTQAMLGTRMDLRIEVLKERYAEAGQLAFTAWWRGDFQLRHPESFDIQTGLLP